MVKPPTQMSPTLDELRNMMAQQQQQQGQPVAPAIIDPTRPGMLQGVGAAYSVNQEIAQGRKLSPATQEGLAALQKQQEKERMDKEREEAKRKEDERKLEEETRALANMGGFDYESFRALLLDNPFLAPGIREQIESNLPRIHIKDLLAGRGKQRVVIVMDPDDPSEKLEVDFQTVRAGEDLLIKHMMRSDADQLATYFDDKRTIYNMAVGIDAINNTPLPRLEDPTAGGKTTESTLTARYEALLELPIQIIAFLAINYAWFDNRVKRAFTPRVLKNG